MDKIVACQRGPCLPVSRARACQRGPCRACRRGPCRLRPSVGLVEVRRATGGAAARAGACAESARSRRQPIARARARQQLAGTGRHAAAARSSAPAAERRPRRWNCMRLPGARPAISTRIGGGKHVEHSGEAAWRLLAMRFKPRKAPT